MGAINNIHSHQIRGIRDLEIRFSGENLLILGENGTGKSSIVDSIELFFTGRIEKLDGRKDVNQKESIPFTGSENVWVEIGLTGEAEPVRMNYSRKPIPGEIPAAYKGFFATAGSRPFILHRYQLLAFIEDKAADRYKRLSNLIGMDAVDAIAEAWKQQLNYFENNLNNALEERRTAWRELQVFLQLNNTSNEDVINYLNNKIMPVGLPQISKRADITMVQEQLKGKFPELLQRTDSQKLRTVLSRLSDLQIGLDAFWAAYADFHVTWQTFIERSAGVADKDYLNILEEGKSFIESKALDECPLCEADIPDRQELVERINARLNQIKELAEARKERDEKRDAVAKLIHSVQEKMDTVQKSLTEAERAEMAEIGVARASFDLLAAAIRQKAFVLEGEVVLRSRMQFDTLQQAVTAAEQFLEARVREMTANEADLNILNLNELLARTDEKWEDCEQKEKNAALQKKRFEQVQKIYQQLIEARRTGIQTILNGLQDEFIRLYNALHPGEGHKAISILMPDNKNNSAELLAEIEGMKATHPLAHYSEGHLDSMGLCIFLALIKKYNKDLNLIILDDVLTSIDSGHRMRVAKLIAREFKDYQIILTTHDEFWANELSTVFGNSGKRIKMIRMRPWNQKDGAQYSDFVATDTEYYLAEIAAGRIQDAVAATGRNLEKFLYTMRKYLHIEVPATFDDRYTIGDLYDKFFKWVNEHPISRPDMADHKQRLLDLKAELDDYWRFRNWSGAHYNDWGAGISAPEARTFVELVQELVSYFQCPACGRLVIYDGSVKVVHCPECKPSPQSKAVWVYKQDWKNRLVNLKTLSSIPDKEIRLIDAIQRTFENYLKDLRRKLGLPVPGNPREEYGLTEIYDIYVEFVQTHPRTDQADEKEKNLAALEALNEFISPERTWVDPGLVREKSQILEDAVSHLSALFECSTCRDLVHYDHKNKTYACHKCDKNEDTIVPGAHWRVTSK